jgi:hypothetical protein
MEAENLHIDFVKYVYEEESLARLRRKWEDNIKFDRTEKGRQVLKRLTGGTL